MITLYGMTVSFPVNRVRLCLNAMEQDYEFVILNPLAGETRTEAFLSMSPAGKIPAIDVDGVTVFESNAIMKYLCRQFESDYYPSDIKQQTAVDSWCDFSAIHVGNGVAKAMFNKVFAPALGMPVDEQSMKDGYGFIERFFAVVDQQLSKTPFIAGDSMTIADFSLLATVDPADVLEVDLNQYPHLNSWCQKLKAEDFYTRMHASFAESLQALMQAMQG